jgi:hypothetical protein
VSRWTSRPATLSRISFKCAPPDSHKGGCRAVDSAKRILGFVLAATIIGTPQSTRQTESAHAVAIGVRRQRPAAANSISSIVGGRPRPSGTEIR